MFKTAGFVVVYGVDISNCNPQSYHSSLTVPENVQLWMSEQRMIVCKVNPK